MIAELSTRLNKHLDHLVEELTEKIPAQLGKDQPHSDYSETVERQRQLQHRIQYLRRVIAGLEVVHPATLEPGQIGFGTQVSVEDMKTGEVLSYTIMNGDILDLDAGEISLASPVGQALLGRREGDEVEVDTPHRRRRFRIVTTVSIFDRLQGQEAQEIEFA